MIALEPISAVYDELLPMFQAHWAERGRHMEHVSLEPDLPMAIDLERRGLFKCVIARSEGQPVGYLFLMVVPSTLHHRHRWAYADVIYVDPAYRDGKLAVEMIKFGEHLLLVDGPVVVQFEALDRALALLLGLLGYSEVSKGFSKRLA